MMSNEIATLSYKIVADTGGFEAGLVPARKLISDVKKAIEASEDPLKRYRDQIKLLEEMQKQDAANAELYAKAIAHVGKEAAEAEKKLAGMGDQDTAAPQSLSGQFQDQLGGMMPGKLSGIAMATGPVAAGFATVAVAIGTASAAAAGFYKASEAIISTALSAIDRLDNLADSAQALGMEATALQKLQAAATLADAPADSLVDALGKMETVLGDPSDDTVAALDGLGLAFNELQAMDAGTAFERIATAIDKVPERSKQLALISDIFGRGNKELINLIDGFEEFSAEAGAFTLTSSQFDAVSGADEAFKQLTLTVGGITDTLGAELAPALTDIATVVAEFLQEDATQSALMTGIVMIRDVMQDIADISKTVKDTFSGDKLRDIVRATGTKGAMAVELFDSITAPYAEKAAAERKFREGEKEAEKAKKEAEAKKYEFDADGVRNMTEKEIEEENKARRKQQKEERERQKKFEEELARQRADIMATEDPTARMRLDAERAGAVTEDEITAYVELRKELDRLKESEDNLKAVQAERSRQAQQDAQDYQKMLESLETPQQKAADELKRFAELGATQDQIDAMAGKLSKDLVKTGGNTESLTGMQKGSRDANAFVARNSRDERQLKALEEIRRLMAEQLKKDVVTVQEVAL